MSRRTVGLLVLALAALSLLGAGGAPPAQALASGETAARCSTSGLVVWLDTRGDGAAGSTYFNLKLTNPSGHVCTLTGYPGVSAVDLAGHCHRVTAAGLRIYPPNQTASKVVPFPFSACSHKGPIDLSIAPVK
jgi:hypothetical protein